MVIHSLTLIIYIAPLQENYSEANGDSIDYITFTIITASRLHSSPSVTIGSHRCRSKSFLLKTTTTIPRTQ